jgi:A/G-specific adenine glycosylase
MKAPDPAELVSLLLRWFDHNARDLPWRRTRDPYAIWISEIMLQQTVVQAVIPYFERWMRKFPTAKSLADAAIDDVLQAWAGLGYYRRARSLHAAAQIILRQHGAIFPRDFDSILDLPGIGRYTAGAISSIAFNQPEPILDGNVIRVLARLFGIRKPVKEKRTQELLWQQAAELVQEAQAQPERSHRHGGNCSAFNQSLMELGAMTCQPRTPRCAECPLLRLCRTAKKPALLARTPLVEKPTASTVRHWSAFILEHENKFLMRKRGEAEVNGGLWEFPNLEVAEKFSPEEAFTSLFRMPGGALASVGSIRHQITRYKNRVQIFRKELTRNRAFSGFTWIPRAELGNLGLPSAHRKIAALLETVD